ncbi:MAG TPA: DUF559 domain-containing protein [Balneolaceae bacterium]|nr:DUF559 domain-containing protein [Balneolaceae bacterium]
MEPAKRKSIGVRLHRQKPIANYIVDFYCPDLLLAIEIDGDSHRFKGESDLERQQELEEMEVEFLGFVVKTDLSRMTKQVGGFSKLFGICDHHQAVSGS